MTGYEIDALECGNQLGVKIISGGQTGVDRAALDAAIAQGVDVGGWCPEGRMAEDGPIPAYYPLQVLPGAGYRKRTERNVINSDGTAIIYFSELSGGTKLTLNFCVKHGKPYVLLCGEMLDVASATSKLIAFVTRHDIQILNVAGPRASGEPRAYPYTKRVLETFLVTKAP